MAIPPSRCWIVDLRTAHEFDAVHFAFTLHLPPEALACAERREAARCQLRDISASGAPLVFVTAAEPSSAKGCSGADPTLVRDAIREFVSAGFARVGLVCGGFAALAARGFDEVNAEGRALLVISESYASANPSARQYEKIAAAANSLKAAASGARQALRGKLSSFRVGRGRAAALEDSLHEPAPDERSLNGC